MFGLRTVLRTPATRLPCLITQRSMPRSRPFSSYMVTPSELSEALLEPESKGPRTVPLCASWFLPNDPEKRTGIATYIAQRIPGARFFDLDAVKDNDSPYPHMLPTAKDFAAAMGQLGIRKDDRIVVYDTKELGIFSAPRVGWTLKVFGHPKVHVLNNFRVWTEQGLPTESGDPEPFERTEYPIPAGTLTEVVNFQTVKRNAQLSGNQRYQLLDARPAGRFDGHSPEPRPGLPSGHVPGSISIPFSDLLDPASKELLPASELLKLFESKGVDFDIPIISSCGTGVTAAVLDAALAETGRTSAEGRFVYDGSWTEWAQRVTAEEGLIITTEK